MSRGRFQLLYLIACMIALAVRGWFSLVGLTILLTIYVCYCPSKAVRG